MADFIGILHISAVGLLHKLHSTMSSLYRKKHSPYWFIQFVDADGTRRNKSTGLRADDPGQTVKARTLRAQLEAQELSRSDSATDTGS